MRWVLRKNDGAGLFALPFVTNAFLLSTTVPELPVAGLVAIGRNLSIWAFFLGLFLPGTKKRKRVFFGPFCWTLDNCWAFFFSLNIPPCSFGWVIILNIYYILYITILNISIYKYKYINKYIFIYIIYI
jgi:hypothetical protein